ncbi:hypothetical protein A7R75_27340 [Mycolicibacterium llatzerense]|nr:hypothetical protein [Mycolicibacterium llatzerense]
MRDCLIGPEGVARLMLSSYCGSAPKFTGAPAWLDRGFECGRGRIVSPWHAEGSAIVTVTEAKLNRYARSLDADLRAELKACQAADRRNNLLRFQFCHCGRHDGVCGYAYMGDRICPPTEQQEADALAEHWRCHEWTEDLLDRALGFECVAEPEPLGQLELFAIGAMSA